jgi:hypothetical protein
LGAGSLDARLVVSAADAGAPLAPGFIGLSYKSVILAAGDYFTPDNASILGLIGMERCEFA